MSIKKFILSLFASIVMTYHSHRQERCRVFFKFLHCQLEFLLKDIHLLLGSLQQVLVVVLLIVFINELLILTIKQDIVLVFKGRSMRCCYARIKYEG